MKGDVESATAEFRTAIRLQPDDATAHINLGVALRTKGDLEVLSPNTAQQYAYSPMMPALITLWGCP